MIGDIFHICNRGFGRQEVFYDETYYRRFLESAYRCNNKNGSIRYRGSDLFGVSPEQDRIIAILKWCILPNHYHFLVCELEEGGASEFASRLGNGYTKYVNTRQERSGYLFQNAAKIIPIQSDSHFLYLPYYIDLNPLDMEFPKWSGRNLSRRDVDKMFSWLSNYRWSSFSSYYGNSQFDSLIDKDMFYEIFDSSPQKHRKGMSDLMMSDNPLGKDSFSNMFK